MSTHSEILRQVEDEIVPVEFGTVRTFLLEEMWAEDLELLRRSCSNVPLNWRKSLPELEDIFAVMTFREQYFKVPPDPFELTPESCAKLLDSLVPYVESQWGCKFDESPKIEIVNTDRYMTRINELEERVNAAMGSGETSLVPPEVFTTHYDGIVLFPEMNVMRVPKSSEAWAQGFIATKESVLRDDYDVVVLPWGEVQLRLSLLRALASWMFREVRGETRGDYIAAMKAMDHQNKYAFMEGMSSTLSLVLQELTQEPLAYDNAVDYAAMIVADKAVTIWNNYVVAHIRKGLESIQMDNYRCARVLARHKSLFQLAQPEFYTFHEDKEIPGLMTVHANFHRAHPRYEDKRKLFEKELTLEGKTKYMPQE